MCFHHTGAFCGQEWQPWSASADRVRGQANLGLLYIPNPTYWNGCRRRHPHCHGDTDAHVPGATPPRKFLLTAQFDTQHLSVQEL